MDFYDRRMLVVGAGVSGVAVARFLVKKGAVVTLTDVNNPTDPDGLWLRLESEGVRLCLGGYPEVNKGSFDMIVMSPGVPLTAPPVRSAGESGIPVTGELELAYNFAKAPIVAITGTNGKTTTTALIGEIFRNYGKATLVGGNIGLPLISAVEEYNADDIIVAEVSSFQLETIVSFRPNVSVILNITPDHLDRHGTMEHYQKLKARIFANQQPSDYIVLNYDDPLTITLADNTGADTIYFSRKKKLDRGVFIDGGKIVAKLGSEREIIGLVRDLHIPGGHNQENALAAVAAAKVMGVSNEVLTTTLNNFKGVPHRQEYVAEVNEVKYVNDSKGTNPEAAIKALESYHEPIVLIAGGKNKGSDFSLLGKKIKERVRVLVVLGQCADLIVSAAWENGFTNILAAVDLKDAVRLAAHAARPGDVVLLSPACASWDMFKNFEERGDLFKKLVLSLN